MDTKTDNGAGLSVRQQTAVRLNATEREKIDRIAAHWGVSMSGAVRRLIREAKVRTTEESQNVEAR